MTRIAQVTAHYLRAELAAPFGWSVYTTPIRQALLVEVRTDDGLTGWGEGGSGTLSRAGASQEVVARGRQHVVIRAARSPLGRFRL